MAIDWGGLLATGAGLWANHQSSKGYDSAINESGAQTGESLARLDEQYRIGKAGLDPYSKAGQASMNRYMTMNGFMRNKSGAWVRNPNYDPMKAGPQIGKLPQFSFDYANFDKNPAYQARLDQGIEAVNRGMGSNRMLNSTNRWNALMGYGGQEASKEIEAQYGREFGEYNQNTDNRLNWFKANRGVYDDYKKNLLLTGEMGRDTATRQAALGENYAANSANLRMGHAANVVAGNQAQTQGTNQLIGDIFQYLGTKPWDFSGGTAGNIVNGAESLVNAGGGNPFSAVGESARRIGSGDWADPLAGPRTSARMPTLSSTGSLVGAQTALGTDVGAGMYMGADGLVTDLTGMAANPGGLGYAGFAAPAAMIGFTKMLANFVRSTRGGSAEGAKMGKFNEQIQRDMQADPSGRTAKRTVDRLLTGGLWAGEGNQWVVDSLFASGLLDKSYPTLYTKNSIVSLDMRPGHDTQASNTLFAEIAGMPEADKEKFRMFNTGVTRATSLSNTQGGDSESFMQRGRKSRVEGGTAEYAALVAKYKPKAIENARVIRAQILAQNSKADVTKLNLFIRSAS